MRAGLLQETINIIRPTTLKNEYGEEDTEWKLIYTTKARLVHNSGSRNNENGEIFYAYVKTFEVRDHVPVEEFDRIEWNTKLFRILDIEPDKHQRKLTIKTELIND